MKKKKEQEENLIEALQLMEKEKGIPMDYMVAQVTKAITTACKNAYDGNDDIVVQFNKTTGKMEARLHKTVVEEVTNPNKEITLEEARKITPSVNYGEKVGIVLDPKDFGRIAVMTARNMIRQGIRDGEKEQTLNEYKNKLQDIVTATVDQVDPTTGNATLRLGKNIAILPKNDQVPGEELHEGDLITVYVVNVKTGTKGPKAIISRTHPDLVKRLFEAEVPEIFNGTVEIKSISREAGSRTKIAVLSNDSDVDAVGACIGPKGQRVGTIVSQLGGEKIDIIEFSEDPIEFIKKALSPAEVLKVVLEPNGEKICKATVPDNQLSLAIGNKGQNVRLAAKLTGWKIDIHPESGYFGEDNDFPEPENKEAEDTDPEDKPLTMDDIVPENEEQTEENTDEAPSDTVEPETEAEENNNDGDNDNGMQ